MTSQPYDIKLPHIEGISAEVVVAETPSIAELRQHKGMVPLLIESEMPEPIVALRLMTGVYFDDSPYPEVSFRGNIDLSDTKEVEDSIDDLLLPSPSDGPPITSKGENLENYNTWRQTLRYDSSIILGSDAYISTIDEKLPKQHFSAFTAEVFANAFRIIRNYGQAPTSSLDPKPVRNLGRFVISSS